MVSHHPPISVFFAEGDGFSTSRVMETSQYFNGKYVKVVQENIGYVTLGEESYEVKNCPLVVGNLLVGDRFIES